jgi:hypothetical protein
MRTLVIAVASGLLAGLGSYLLVRCPPALDMVAPPLAGSPRPVWAPPGTGRRRPWCARFAALAGVALGLAASLRVA